MSAFATLNISPDVLRVMATQARVGELHFYMPTPVQSYWGDLQTLAERLRSGAPDPFGEAAGENRLLEAWGAAGRDFMAVLGSYEVVHPAGEIAAYSDPEEDTRPTLDEGGLSDSLLHRLQRDLFHRRALPSGELRDGLRSDDPSLQVHACHTRLRELQVLHDQLRSLLQDPRFDPPLQAREIAVLAPDIDPYVPYLEAVFGGRGGEEEHIPYALADSSPLAGEPLADVFVHLLGLPVSRFGLNEVLDLLASAPLAEAAGLEAVDFDRLHGWLQQAGARWGLDAKHRNQHQAPADDAYTWQFALDRLVLGHATGSEADLAGVAPWIELEGGALDALDRLLRLLRVLAIYQRRLGELLTPAQWRQRLLSLLDALLPTAPSSPNSQRALERLRKLLNQFAEDAAKAGFEEGVPPEVVRAHFAGALGEADTRAPLLTGGISFGRMVPSHAGAADLAVVEPRRAGRRSARAAGHTAAASAATAGGRWPIHARHCRARRKHCPQACASMASSSSSTSAMPSTTSGSTACHTSWAGCTRWAGSCWPGPSAPTRASCWPAIACRHCCRRCWPTRPTRNSLIARRRRHCRRRWRAMLRCWPNAMPGCVAPRWIPAHASRRSHAAPAGAEAYAPGTDLRRSD